MRNPSDLPSRGDAAKPARRRRFSDRGRVLLITTVVVVVGLLLFARFFAGFFVDYLWHHSVGRTDVFWGVLSAKLLMFAVFATTFIAMAVINLLIADRLAPGVFSANTHPLVERFHDVFGQRFRLFRIGVAVIIGLLFAAPAIGHWQDWMLFRNSKSFGIREPQFGHDIGFYMFRLPFVTFLLDWMFAALVFITLLTIATHVLSGGIIIQPPRPKIRRATKAHLAVLLAMLALVKAADYWVQRYQLTAESRSIVRGATYTEVEAHLPAIVLLGLIAVLTACLFLSTLKTGSWRLPLIASALWAVMALVGGVIYPAAVQTFVVNPNQGDREALYIRRNVEATRHALGIDNVQPVTVNFGDVSVQDLNASADSLKNARLLSPVKMVDRFRIDEGIRAGLTINDLDVDRYAIDGRQQQVIVGARELDLNKVANKTWQGKHLISTHGCGLVMAPAGKRDANGRPAYMSVQLQRPELYFGENLGGYSIVDTAVREEICPAQTDPGAYAGNGGVKLDSTIRRLSFALEALDYNLVGSSAVSDSSRLLSHRSVRERVSTLAPFLSFDGDPYPVQLDGRVLWVVDGYSTSDRYPYGQNGDRSQLASSSGLDHPFNYVRNSVKAVVDAYDGTTTFYAIDDVDPVLKVWEAAFPKLFHGRGEMPPGLVDHLRYPEELFRVQTAAYSKYQLSPEAFFSRDGAWSVAQAPTEQTTSSGSSTATGGSPTATTIEARNFANDSTSAKFVPYYSMFRPPNSDSTSFQLYRPFVPFSSTDERRELRSFMTASSDPATYGQLIAYTVSNYTKVEGPLDVANTMNTDAKISGQITLIDQRGSKVVLGDLQMVPVGQGIVWLRPLYAEPENGANQSEVRFVLAQYGNRATFGASIEEALRGLFNGFTADLGDVVGSTGNGTGAGGTTPPGGVPPPTTPPTTAPGAGPGGTGGSSGGGSSGGTPTELLARADQLFTEADVALKSGDLGTYKDKIEQAKAFVKQAADQLRAGG